VSRFSVSLRGLDVLPARSNLLYGQEIAPSCTPALPEGHRDGVAGGDWVERPPSNDIASILSEDVKTPALHHQPLVAA